MLRKIVPIVLFAALTLACSTALGQETAAPEATVVSTADTAAPEASPTTAPATEVPTNTPEPSPEPAACSLAYVQSNEVYCLGPDGAPVLIARTDHRVGRLAISTDGSLVAYTVESEESGVELWVARADGSGARVLAGPADVSRGDPNVRDVPYTFQWRPGTHLLYFNTRYQILSGEMGPGEYLHNDLWTADADTGEVRGLLGRESVGRFFFSPDGEWLGLSLPQSIGLMRADGSEFRSLLEFPFVMTYSEWAYTPSLVWSPDGGFFSTVLPSADPLAPDAHATLYRLGLDGSVQELGTLAGNFVFGDASGLPPAFSPDGAHVFHATRSDPAAPLALMLRNVNTGADSPLASVEAMIAHGFGWSPDSRHVALSTDWVGRSFALHGAEGAIGPASGIAGLVWKDDHTVVYWAEVDGTPGLYSQRLDGAPELLVGSVPQETVFTVHR